MLHLRSQVHPAIAAAETPRMLINAMRNHRRNGLAQEQGCERLRHFMRDPEARAQVALDGGIEHMISILKKQWQNCSLEQVENIHAQACAVLRVVSLLQENRAKVASAGGVHSLVLTAETHPDHPGVQEHFAGALRALAIHRDTSLVKIPEAGGIKALLL